MNIITTKRKQEFLKLSDNKKPFVLGIYFTLNITLPIMLHIRTKIKTCFCHEKCVFSKFV